jgi:hypothetical protein
MERTMDPEQSLNRLSHITTLWTLVRKAHEPGSTAHAQEEMMRRYGGAVHR